MAMLIDALIRDARRNPTKYLAYAIAIAAIAWLALR
jgi:hypothetical protein